jgi:hypothetical protein
VFPLEQFRFKPGQSGNPKGRPKGSRNKLGEEFFRDLCDAWQAFGKPALMTAAWTHPVEFVRVVASLIPRELEATATVTERMSDAQLEAIIARGIEGGLAEKRKPAAFPCKNWHPSSSKALNKIEYECFVLCLISGQHRESGRRNKLNLNIWIFRT